MPPALLPTLLLSPALASAFASAFDSAGLSSSTFMNLDLRQKGPIKTTSKRGYCLTKRRRAQENCSTASERTGYGVHK